MDRFRKFLEKNKDIINLITSSLLGFMALTVSVKSCEIADANLKVAEMSYLPVISVNSTLQQGVETIIIDNKGYHIKEFKSINNSFLEFEYDYVEEKNTRVIRGYFMRKYSTKNTVGVMMTLVSNGNYNSIVDELSKNIHDRYRGDDGAIYNLPPPGFLNMSFFHILSLSYVDGLDQINTKYYRISRNRLGVEISEDLAANYIRITDNIDSSLALDFIDPTRFLT